MKSGAPFSRERGFLSVSFPGKTLSGEKNVTVRTIHRHELPQLLALYRQLNPNDEARPSKEVVESVWDAIQANPALHYFAIEREGRLVSACALTIIPNLTRGARPYGLIENVVTDSGFRRQGLGGAVLRAALKSAWNAGCYKVMLMTGSKRDETLSFYEGVGFKRGSKTGFVAYPNAAAGTVK